MKTKRAFFSVLILILLFAFNKTALSFDENIVYKDNCGDNGFTLLSQSAEGVEISFSVNEFSIIDTSIDGQPSYRISSPGCHFPSSSGAPDLPQISRYIAIPAGAKVSFKIVASKSETFENMELSPSPGVSLAAVTSNQRTQKNRAIYLSNQFYPEHPVGISEPANFRGVDVVLVNINPFQYNPVSKQLIVIRDLKIEVSFSGGNGQFGDERLRNRWWDTLLDDLLINFESLPELDYYQAKNPESKEQGAEYLIISPNGPEFQQWADSIRNFRTLQGILTKVATLDEIGGNSIALIENYINEAYNTWDIPPAAILLLGDHGTDPSNSVESPVWDNYCVSDNVYADVNGDDLPDIIAARICAQNATQLETMVGRVLNYEKNPPFDSDFYDHPITSCFFQPGSWNQLLTESIAGFYEVELSKSTNRINVCNGAVPDVWSIAPGTEAWVNYFGPDGLGYIPLSPTQVNCNWDGSTEDIISGINTGAYMLLHKASGFEQGWTEPPFSNSDIDALTNPDPTFVWSVNSLTGKFNSLNECFAENFHRHAYGALGIIAASEITYSFVLDIFTWGAFDNMWPEFMPETGSTFPSIGVLPAFANVAGKYYLDQYPGTFNPNTKAATYHAFHYFGDAFSTVYTEMPQELTVEHSSWLLEGTTTFEITSDEASLIALSVEGELIAVAEGTGLVLTINIPAQFSPGQMLVTVTKQNFYRYEAWVPVGTGTGIQKENLLGDVNVFPNPTKGKLYLDFFEGSNPVSIKIMNALNKVIYRDIVTIGKENPVKLEMNGLANGIYYLHIESQEINCLRKIIVSR